MLSVKRVTRKRSNASKPDDPEAPKRSVLSDTKDSNDGVSSGDTPNTSLAKGMAEMNQFLNSSLSTSTVTEYKVNLTYYKLSTKLIKDKKEKCF